ncbi:MAG: Hsp20/alpha crystallin family protein [Flavobacteriales bacterium]|nr:Hsp20/alpha crystallin family protein [Flavobacteriales bacterium]
MTLIKRAQRPLGFPSIFDDLFVDNLWPVQAERAFRNSSPAVNIKETAEGFELEMAAPGLQKDDFNIKLEDDVLTISSGRGEKQEEKSDDGKYHRREFYFSGFSRSFTLPEQVDGEQIKAGYNNGVLHISIPFKPAAVSKSKEIVVG